MSDAIRRDWSRLDERLDQTIDALNLEHAPLLFEDDDPELISLVDTLRIVRSLREPAEPADDFPDQLVSTVMYGLTGGATTPRPGDNGRVRMSPAVIVIRPRRQVELSYAAALLSVLGIGVMAGMLAGLLAGGVGGRVVMRISALLYERAYPGEVAITESSGQVVGTFSIEGTIELLINGMFTGVLGGLFYVIVRPWLPRSGRLRGLAFGGLMLTIMGVSTINSGNRDFERLGSPLLNVAMFAALFLLFGLIVAPVADRLERWISVSGGRQVVRRSVAVAAGLCALPLVLILFTIGVVILIASIAGLIGHVVGVTEMGLLDSGTGLIVSSLVLFLPIARLLVTPPGQRFVARVTGRASPEQASAVAIQLTRVVQVVLVITVIVGSGMLVWAIVTFLSASS